MIWGDYGDKIQGIVFRVQGLINRNHGGSTGKWNGSWDDSYKGFAGIAGSGLNS